MCRGGVGGGLEVLGVFPAILGVLGLCDARSFRSCEDSTYVQGVETGRVGGVFGGYFRYF